MISNKNRSLWFGASDADFIVGNWGTKTFKKWWLVKLGLTTNNFSTVYTRAGTVFEHAILNVLGFPVHKDRQVIIPQIRLRVNLDGDTADTIFEVKTYKAGKRFAVSKKYYRQVQVQMYAAGKRKAYVVAYPMTDENYTNFFTPIDAEKIELFPIAYDREFVEKIFLPKIRALCVFLRKGGMPL